MQPAHLIPHLNCPWRAAAIARMARLTMLAPAATVGLVPFQAPLSGASTSVVSQPIWASTIVLEVSPSVALRINNSIKYKELSTK